MHKGNYRNKNGCFSYQVPGTTVSTAERIAETTVPTTNELYRTQKKTQKKRLDFHAKQHGTKQPHEPPQHPHRHTHTHTHSIDASPTKNATHNFLRLAEDWSILVLVPPVKSVDRTIVWHQTPCPEGPKEIVLSGPKCPRHLWLIVQRVTSRRRHRFQSPMPPFHYRADYGCDRTL